MKKVALTLAALSFFAFSTAAFACDGNKAECGTKEKTSDKN